MNKNSKNLGISRRAPAVADIDFDKARKSGDNAFSFNSYDAILYKKYKSGQKCSCLNINPQPGNTGSSFIDGSTIVFDEPEEDKTLEFDEIDEIIQTLDRPSAVCPVCFSTGFIGGYRLFNTSEVVLATTTTHEKHNIKISGEKPSFFEPIHEDNYIIFSCFLQPFYDKLSFSAFTEKYETFPYKNIQILQQGQFYSNIEQFTFGEVTLKIKLEKPIHCLILRQVNGSSVVRLNFPGKDFSMEETYHDFYDSMSVHTDSSADISTADVLFDEKFGRFWRVFSTSKKQPKKEAVFSSIQLELKRIKNHEIWNELRRK